MIDQGLLARRRYGDLRDLIARRSEDGGVVSVGARRHAAHRVPAHARWPTCRSCRCSTDGKLVGVIDESDLLLQRARRRRRAFASRCSSAMTDALADAAARAPSLGASSQRVLDRGLVAIVADADGFHGLITRFDLLNHLRRSADDDATTPAQTDRKHGFATRVIHAGQSPDPTTGAIMPPIYATSTYVQQSPGVHKGLDYGRSHNPTRWAFERCVADLEGGAQALRVRLRAGRDLDRARAARRRRARRRRATTCTAARSGCSSACARAAPAIDFSFVDLTDLDALRAAHPARDARWSGSRRRPTRCSSWPTCARSPQHLPRARHHRGGRQHLRQPLRAAAARARLRHRRALDHQVPERPLRRDRRRRGRRRRRAPGRLRERLGFLQNAVGAIAGPVRQLPRAARREDAGAAHGAPLRATRWRWRSWLETQPKVARVHYPGLRVASAARAGASGRCTASAAWSRST